VASRFSETDATVADYCRERGKVCPAEPEAAAAPHIKAIEQWLDRAGRWQNEDRAEVIDIGERRPGDDEIA